MQTAPSALFVDLKGQNQNLEFVWFYFCSCYLASQESTIFQTNAPARTQPHEQRKNPHSYWWKSKGCSWSQRCLGLLFQLPPVAAALLGEAARLKKRTQMRFPHQFQSPPLQKSFRQPIHRNSPNQHHTDLPQKLPQQNRFRCCRA